MKVYERTENGVTTHVSIREAMAEVNDAMMGRLSRERSVRRMSSGRTQHQIEYADGREVRMTLVDAPAEEASTPELTRQCVPYAGGKVHTMSPGAPEGHAFPLCRTGGSTNRGTRYREVSAPLTCTTCLTYEERRNAARTGR